MAKQAKKAKNAKQTEGPAPAPADVTSGKGVAWSSKTEAGLGKPQDMEVLISHMTVNTGSVRFCPNCAFPLHQMKLRDD